MRQEHVVHQARQRLQVRHHRLELVIRVAGDRVGLLHLGEIGDEGADVGRRFLFQIMKTGNDVGDLDAGVINIVLHFHFAAAITQHTDEGVAQDGVA